MLFPSSNSQLHKRSGPLENHACRALSRLEAIQKFGAQAARPTQETCSHANPRLRARALWALGKLPGLGEESYKLAFADRDANVRMMGIRLARQLNVPVEKYAPAVIGDASPQVRRELAIALRFDQSAAMPKLWSELAVQHDGKDRWYLEALGIAAELRWPECFAEYMKVASNASDEARRDIIWRSRAPEAAQGSCQAANQLAIAC